MNFIESNVPFISFVFTIIMFFFIFMFYKTSRLIKNKSKIEKIQHVCFLIILIYLGFEIFAFILMAISSLI